MKKAFMEPELKVTQFDYEEMICSGVIVGGEPDVDGPEVDFDDWR